MRQREKQSKQEKTQYHILFNIPGAYSEDEQMHHVCSIVPSIYDTPGLICNNVFLHFLSLYFFIMCI